MSFGIFVLGYAIFIGGLAWGASLLHVPGQWIGVGTIMLVGIGIVTAVKATRQKDSVK